MPMLLITYAEADVPSGGSCVYGSLTALSLSYSKDAAGHIYHLKALKQAGLHSKLQHVLLLLLLCTHTYRPTHPRTHPLTQLSNLLLPAPSLCMQRKK
jgi:hypothetical protein